MVENGADIIDVGGESTRPGYQPVDPLSEMNRVVPVIERLAKEINVPISVDTSKAAVAEKAIMAGASIVNDVWGMQRDKNMAEVVSKTGAGVVVMHNSHSEEYTDLMGDIIKFLKESIRIAGNAGIHRERVVVDPGIGFGKTLQHNLEVMRRLKELDCLNVPVLIGTSRKSLIGNVLNLPVNERLEGTAATVALGIANGADIVRVHDVKRNDLGGKNDRCHSQDLMSFYGFSIFNIVLAHLILRFKAYLIFGRNLILMERVIFWTALF